MPWPIRSGRRCSTTSPSSSPPVSPSSPTWIVIPRPGRARGLDHGRDLRVVVAAAAGAWAGDVDPDDAARGPADRLLDDDLVLARVEGAVHHQDQPGAHLRVLERGAVEAADRGEDDVVEVALAAAVALHRVEAELERRDPLAAVGAADRAVHGLLDGQRRRLDQLGPVVDPVERVEVLDPARIGDGDERVELPVVLHRQRDPLLVRERPEDVGGDRAAEVGVQLGETLGEHSGDFILRGYARRHRSRPAGRAARLRAGGAPLLRRAARARGGREARAAARRAAASGSGSERSSCTSASSRSSRRRGRRTRPSPSPATTSSSARLRAAGVAVTDDDSIPGVRRCHVADPWGNRIELVAVENGA